MTPEPYFDGTSWWYSKATWRHAQQTKERAAENRRTKRLVELERLRRLGATDDWLRRAGEPAEGGAR